MLRKATSFFDSSLKSPGRDLEACKTTCRIRDRLTQLVQDISVANIYGAELDQSCVGALAYQLENCIKGSDGRGGVIPIHRATDFYAVAQQTTRLEFVFSCRWRGLSVHFFTKNARKPFYKLGCQVSGRSGFPSFWYWGRLDPSGQEIRNS